MKLTPGQLSLWDIEITEKPASVTKTKDKITKSEVLDTKKINSFTDSQEKVIEQYKENPGLHRIIQYCGGGVGIELLDRDLYKTIYVNKEGKEEFSFNKKIPVLPMDRIIYCKEDLKPNSLQEERLKGLRVKYPMAKIIKRRGHQDIILELQDKVISITPEWVLEYQNVRAIYEEDEVIQEDAVEDLESIQGRVKPGDFVQAQHGKAIIEGTITREYGIGNAILNIAFDNDKKCTAIGRMHVVKILKSA